MRDQPPVSGFRAQTLDHTSPVQFSFISTVMRSGSIPPVLNWMDGADAQPAANDACGSARAKVRAIRKDRTNIFSFMGTPLSTRGGVPALAGEDFRREPGRFGPGWLMSMGDT